MSNNNRTAFWTTVGGVAAVIGVVIALVQLLGGASRDPSNSGASQPTSVPMIPSTDASTANTSRPTESTPIPVQFTTSASPAQSQSPIAQTTYLTKIHVSSGGYDEKGPHSISGQLYVESFKKFCPGSITPSATSWPVAGYSRLTAVIGVADDESDAIGRSGRVSIKNEVGTDLITSFDVSFGNPRTIDIPLNGAIQLQVICDGRIVGKSLYVTLGDPAVRR